MPSKYGNTAFYNSKKWRTVSAAYMSSKNYICERCGSPAQICHHKTWLNAHNVHDPEIALNFDNLEAVCIECHNTIHAGDRNISIFDDSGNVVSVKENKETKDYQRERDQISETVERARALFCGLMG